MTHPTPTAPDYAGALKQWIELIIRSPLTGDDRGNVDVMFTGTLPRHVCDTIRQALALAAEPPVTSDEGNPRLVKDMKKLCWQTSDGDFGYASHEEYKGFIAAHYQTICGMVDELNEVLSAYDDLSDFFDVDDNIFPDADSIGWNGDGEMPTTFGQIRRLKKSVDALRKHKGD